MSRVTLATVFALLIFAAPASAATTAAAGPSPTPLILELILAAVVAAGMALRGPARRAAASVRRAVTPKRQSAQQPRARRA
jgi:hypothetical protein